jgi:hypothetical protein
MLISVLTASGVQKAILGSSQQDSYDVAAAAGVLELLPAAVCMLTQ